MSRTVSHIRIRYSKSRLISGLVREAPAVRRMMPMPSGTSRSCTTSFSRERSCAEVILRLKEVDRKSTRLNSSHVAISYAVFCLKKKKKDTIDERMHVTHRCDYSRGHLQTTYFSS